MNVPEKVIIPLRAVVLAKVLKRGEAVLSGRGRAFFRVVNQLEYREGFQVVLLSGCQEIGRVYIWEVLGDCELRISDREKSGDVWPFFLRYLNGLNVQIYGFERGESKNQSTTKKQEKRGGGPLGTDEEKRVEICKGWLEVKGRNPKRVYCQLHGVSVSTLDRWVRQLKADGKL